MTDIAFGLAILAGASFPAAVDAEAPGATTGRAAVERLIGNTLEEDDSASPDTHVIFLKQGGITRMRAHGKGQRIMKQHWTISPDGLLCVSEARSPANTASQCAAVAIDGDRVEMSVADLDEPLTARLLPGNPYKF